MGIVEVCDSGGGVGIDEDAHHSGISLGRESDAGKGVPFDELLPGECVALGEFHVDDAVLAVHDDESDERHEVRFALTSEAGLNDGLAFPFVYAAIFLLEKGATFSWVGPWIAWELVGKVVLGFLVGAMIGWLLAQLAFRARRASLRLALLGESQRELL